MDSKIDNDIDLETKRSNELNSIYEIARRTFSEVQTATASERQQCLQDRRYCWVAGAMWEDFLQSQWSTKPRLEINTVQLGVTRINNEYRANRISATFTPADGSNIDEEVDNLNSLYRAQRKANGTEFADNAFLDAVSGGIGAWRLRAEYEDEYDPDNNYQVIRFEPIFDADTSVFFDPNSKRQDKADAKHCFVITSMDAKQFEIEHGQLPATWGKNNPQGYFDWYKAGVVYLAEYYRVEVKNETIRFFRGLGGDERKLSSVEYKDKEYVSELESQGYTEARKKVVKRQRVHKYIMSGGGILEDCGYIAGKYIPIIVTYGKRSFIDNMERASGYVRICKDAGRLQNVQASKAAEIASGSSVGKPIFRPAQVKGHEYRWANDAVEDYPYQLINQDYDDNGSPLPAGPAGLTQPPDLPPALAALLQYSSDRLQELMGNASQGEQLKSNLSGIAVELIQAQISVQTAGYMSNFAIAETWAAKVWLEMAKELYTEDGRKMKGENSGGKPEQLEIKKPIVSDDGTIKLLNDFSNIKLMDVEVEVGPSSASRRAATEKGLMGLMGNVQDPNTQSVLANMLLANSEGEGMSEVRPYFRKQLIQQGAIEPTDGEQKQMSEEAQANQAPPNPQDQANTDFLNASAQAESAKAENLKAQTFKTLKEAEQVEANTAKLMADARLTEAKMIGTMQGLEESKLKIINDWAQNNLLPNIEPQSNTQ